MTSVTRGITSNTEPIFIKGVLWQLDNNSTETSVNIIHSHLKNDSGRPIQNLIRNKIRNNM